MYKNFYGIKKDPFSLSPDPEFLYLSDEHKSALARINYAVEKRRGLTVIYGEVGTGKTTLSRLLYEQYNQADNSLVALLINPEFSTQNQLLKAVMLGFGIDNTARSKFTLLNNFNSFLVENAVQKDRNIVLIIDEAQGIITKNLELLRQLLNFESNQRKFLQIVLLGQPELYNKLQHKRSLKDRIAVIGALDALDRENTAGLIKHRLRVSGCDTEIFSQEAIDEIYQYTNGFPRRISVVCENVLILGFAKRENPISKETVLDVISDFERNPKGQIF